MENLLIAVIAGVLVLLASMASVEFGVSVRSSRSASMFTTLLMSTGLTFGTISSLYGLNAGILDRAQFSVLVTVVVASAVIPTVIAQRWFPPAPVHASAGTAHAGRRRPARPVEDASSDGRRSVLGHCASPYFVTRWPATLNVQGVRLASLASSCLVWLAT